MNAPTKKLALAAVLAVAACAPAATDTAPQKPQVALPAPSAETRGKLETMLNAFEWAPNAAVLAPYGREGYAALLGFVRDPNALLSVRARAVTALMWSDQELARQDLPGIATDASMDPAMRRSAARALGKLGGVSALAPLEKLLAERDPELRESAVWALGGMNDATALRVLDDHFARESSPVVRETMQKFLRK